MRAVYNLSWRLTSFNVFEWLAEAAGRGASEIIFDHRAPKYAKWSAKVCEQRFLSICEPAPALLGLPHRVIKEGPLPEGSVDPVKGNGGGPLVSYLKDGGTIPRLRSVRGKANVPYTVTLRKTERSPLRNSALDVWLEFAAEIGALIIPDYEDDPIHLHDRMRYYAGAEMNFFVSNGPAVMCSLSEYPCMLFNTKHARESLLADGMADGEQYPWLLPNQRAIWEEATPESLRRHFDYWRLRGAFAEDTYGPR